MSCKDNAIMNIIYYISSHGFGHASRQSAVMQELVTHGVNIYVRSATSSKFFDIPNVEFHREYYDIGLIQPDALTVDAKSSLQWYANFLEREEEVIAQEVAFIREHDIQLVVSDIAPIAFDIAERAKLPSIFTSHFAWDWIYELYLEEYPEFNWVVDRIRESYQKATMALQMPFAHDFSVFPTVEPISLVVRRPTKSRAGIFQEFNIPENNYLATISMGGTNGVTMNVDKLDEMDNWTFLVVPELWKQVCNMHNCRLIPPNYKKHHNLLVSSDVVVGKAGGATVAQCLASRTPMIYTIRENYRENELLHQGVATVFQQSPRQ